MKLFENIQKLIEMYRNGEIRKVLDIFDQEVLVTPDTQAFRKKGVIQLILKKIQIYKAFWIKY